MDRKWYFVRKLRSHEQPERIERFEIQILDNEGRAKAVGYISEHTNALTIGSEQIPAPVLDAAKSTREGKGDYVGPDGKSLPPF